ncbi:MAG: phosphate signaling complex protein PhoU [Candidatus Thioglobus sp.]|jgi:phosphate transport system protein|nr:phosphate signaling complex protein PhoU [Candidatus Thioglobus sp.]MDP0595102.1 phosphate signaling complex protein PhoU [Candidatus Thioglobus sp.]|tara:strand:- start:2170 stop:2883 length:714 start_codon:yes stop_codon:yes gene_type:complete
MEKTSHISNQFDHDLESIRSNVLLMGGLVEVNVKNAIKSLLERDQALAEEVSTADFQVNKMEIEIDEECTQIIARRQPAAGDLRLVLTVVKVITDLERIGDEAEKIGRYAQTLASKKAKTGMHLELDTLAQKVTSMLNKTLDAFARMDAVQALEVVALDIRIDEEFDRISRLLVSHMMEEPKNIKSMLRVSWCARSLERIGDHAQNICEYVIYSVHGEDVRHTDIDKVRKEYLDNKG